MCQNKHVSVYHGEKIPRYRWFAMLRQWVKLACWKNKLKGSSTRALKNFGYTENVS